MTDAEITVTMPAESRFVALARVTAAGLAAEMDFGVTDIEDLRTGANELVAILVEWAEDHGCDHVDLTFRLDAERVELDAVVPTDAPIGAGTRTQPAEEPLDELSRRILTAVVDEHDIGWGRGRIVKRRTPE